MDLSKHWKTIVDTLRDGLLVVNPEGVIIGMNPAAEALTGYRSDELVGRSCRVLRCSGCEIFGRGSAENWCGLFQDGMVKAKRCVITNKDQREVNIVKNAAVLRDVEGRTIGAVETLSDISELVRQQEEILSLKKNFDLEDGFHGILGKSLVMQKLFEMIENVAQSDAPVMIHGPSGTGKEMVARAIHHAGPRKERPFIKVNCAALNENLLESELFGHVKGAYTGADRNRLGRFEAAQGGSIFLDEIGDIPHATQVRLLRVLEEREIERVGDHTPIKVDVRIISATNRNLENLVEQGGFREDLFFRINVFPLSCPPLSERSEDIPIIVQNFLRKNNRKTDKKILGLTPGAIERLTNYPWPGNVRELRNAIEYAFVLCPGGGIDENHLPPKIMSAERSMRKTAQQRENFEAEREEMIEALRKAGGNQSEAGRILGVSRVTVWKRIKKYGINIPQDLQGSS